MRRAIRRALWWLARLIVPLRYRVRVHGFERARDLKGPVLLLPNHPGYIDPILILTYLHGAFRPRPVLYEDNFRSPVLRPLVNLLRAVPIPDLDRPSHEALKRTEQAVAQVIEGLRRGENFVLWPAGRVERDGLEHLGAARALTDILRAVPEAAIVLVRTRGVWGSSFTYARTGRRPALGRCFGSGFLWLVANLLFFMPRRRVEITIEPLERGSLPELERDSVNRWFEARYNAGGPERPTFVPYHFLFGPRSYAVPARVPYRSKTEVLSEQIRPETRDAVAEILADKRGRPLTAGELQPGTTLDAARPGQLAAHGSDAGCRAAIRFLGRFGARHCRAAHGSGRGASRKGAAQAAAAEWFRPTVRSRAASDPGTNDPRGIRCSCPGRSPHGVAAADDLSGVVSFERLLAGALVMARRFKRLPEVNVGLMLPASVACDMMLLGLLLAGKRPVLLNWTTGPANLQHAVRLTGLAHVISSWHLRDRLSLTIEGVQFLDVEDLAPGRSAGSSESARSWRCTGCPDAVRRRVPQALPDDHAAILFTSGSEKAPKAVPLTHRNILANQASAVAALGPTARDSILSFLPMFHSFGFTVTGLLPLLAGVRMVHHADPTDSAALARKVAAYRPDHCRRHACLHRTSPRSRPARES